MKEDISVEAGICCTHSLNETFRSVIRWYSFFAAVRYSRIWANSSFAARRAMSGDEFLCTEGSRNGREPHANVANDSSPRKTCTWL
jgi:hypothetical protein